MEPLFLCFWARVGEWEFEVHSGNTSTKTQRHVHVRRVRGRKGEYAWNIDGTRHDKKSFPHNERDIERAKQIAGERLKVDPNIFTFVTAFGPLERIYIASPQVRFPVYPLLRIRSECLLLVSDEWVVIMDATEIAEST